MLKRKVTMIKKLFFLIITLVLISSSNLFSMERRKGKPGKNALERKGEAERKKRNSNVVSKKAKKKIKKDTSCTCSECTSVCLCGALGCAWGMWVMSDEEIIKNNTLGDENSLQKYLFTILSTGVGATIGKFSHLFFKKE